MSFLEKLKSKSSGVKAQISFWSSAAVAGAIAFVWVTTLPTQFNPADTIAVVQEKDTSGFGEMFGGVRTQLGALAAIFTAAPEEQPVATTTPEKTEPIPTLNFAATSSAATSPKTSEKVILIATTSTEKR